MDVTQSALIHQFKHIGEELPELDWSLCVTQKTK